MMSATLPVSPWFVQTKFRPPLLRADVVRRTRLLNRLRAAITQRGITLISAPVGSGKTTLLAALAHMCPDLPLAWIALDEQDNDPAIFLAVVVAAMQRLHPACGARVQAMLASGFQPRSELWPLMSVLLNEIIEYIPAPAAIVLDDLHVITEPAIHNAIGQLIERLPPGLHLILATRSDPPVGLPRLRARRQVAEFRLADLRFTLDETGDLLNTALSQGIGEAQVLALHQRTEGWVAGISLLVSSLERIALPSEREAFIQRLQHTDRTIFEYLAEEVLERQDPFVRMFLLETAILPELTPAACSAVTGREDAAAVLDDLYRHNLFLVELDEAGSGATYRYHDLFASFLRERLKREHPTWLRDLHRRAAKTEMQPARRIQHYLQVELWDDAAGVVEQVGDQLVQQGAVTTLRQLIEALPADARTQRPRIIYLYAMSLYHQWQLEAARPWLERAVREFGAAHDLVGQGETLSYLADVLRMTGEYEGARTTTAAALALCPAATAAGSAADHPCVAGADRWRLAADERCD